MSISVTEIFSAVGLTPIGPIPFSQAISEDGPGVYMICGQRNPRFSGVLDLPLDINMDVAAAWFDLASNMKLDGSRPPNVQQIINRIQEYWHRDEYVYYIGQSEVGLSQRVRNYYLHRIGNKGNHHGGHWLKLLNNQEDLFVFYAICPNPKQNEFKMLLRFAELHSGQNYLELVDLGRNLPFANLHAEIDKGHRIGNPKRP